MSAPDSPPPPHPPGRTRRWLVPLLVASVAVNLVIVSAAVSGQYWSEHDERRGGAHRSADLMPRTFFRGLDEDRRSELVEVFRARKSEYREERQTLREAAAALADALEREPFDAELAQVAIADHTAGSHQLVDLGAAVAGELVEAMTPDERRAMAEAIRIRLEAARERRKNRSR